MNISLRIGDDLKSRLDKVADQLDRPRAWVALESIRQFLDYQDWFNQTVERAVKAADTGGPFLSHEEVVAQASQRRLGRTK